MATQEPVQPAHRRGLSFNSGKSSSHQSSGSKSKIDVKQSTKMTTHADPTLAMSELQPSAMALEKSNLQSLRGVQYKDRFGNPITEPDLSNPTRHRFERPLETIRSFEAAISGTYSQRRQSYVRADESTQGGYSRPDSYIAGGGQGNGYNRGYDMNGQYGRGNQSRPDSYIDAYGGNNQYPRGQRHNQRANGDQWYGSSQQGYGHQYAGYPPNDVNASPSGSGSGNLSADQLAQSTDPSSVNSSMDHLQNRAKPGMQPSGDAYGFNGFGGEPQLDYSQHYGNDQAGYADYPVQHGYAQEADYGAPVPAPPPKDNLTTLRKKPVPQQKEVKRKSFFKRFSKG